MTDREFFVETIKDELPRFERVLGEAAVLGREKLDWRPHSKSRSAWELLEGIFGGEAGSFTVFLKTGEIDFSVVPAASPRSVSDVTAIFKKGLSAAEEIASGMSEKDWDSKAVGKMDGKTAWESTKGRMAWGMLFDLIHHRGQLMTYLRPMGGKVPSVYGPSGDSA